jgi:prevent-host-death family protein
MADTVSTAELKARTSELVRRAEITGKPIGITRRGKLVAHLVPAAPHEQADEEDWVLTAMGLLNDAPEVVEAINEAYAERQKQMPKPRKFPWDDE